MNPWCLFKEVFSRLTGVKGTSGPWSPCVYQSLAKSWRVSPLWGSLAGVGPSSSFDHVSVSPRAAPNCQNRTSQIKPNLFSQLLYKQLLACWRVKAQSIGVNSRKTASWGGNVRPPDVPGGLVKLVERWTFVWFHIWSSVNVGKQIRPLSSGLLDFHKTTSATDIHLNFTLKLYLNQLIVSQTKDNVITKHFTPRIVKNAIWNAYLMFSLCLWGQNDDKIDYFLLVYVYVY